MLLVTTLLQHVFRYYCRESLFYGILWGNWPTQTLRFMARLWSSPGPCWLQGSPALPSKTLLSVMVLGLWLMYPHLPLPCRWSHCLSTCSSCRVSWVVSSSNLPTPSLSTCTSPSSHSYSSFSTWDGLRWEMLMIVRLDFSYHKSSNISRTLVCNNTVDHSDVVKAALLQLHLHTWLNTWLQWIG